MRLLIAIPVYNERKYVRRVLDKIRRFHPDLLVVDDGSTDGTRQILDARAKAGDLRVIHHPRNLGYGQSLIDAFRFADEQGYDWVITMDCDEQHEPEMIPEFVRQIRANRWDLISGSRYLNPRRDDDLPPGDRRTINAQITALVNDLFHLGITDAFCGYKAHRVSSLRQLSLTEAGYAFPLQFWPQVWHAGLRVKEIPVRLIYNDPTRHFGGNLDDAGNRLRHYLAVLDEEMKRLSVSSPRAESAALKWGIRNDTHPGPLPEYREREQEDQLLRTKTSPAAPGPAEQELDADRHTPAARKVVLPCCLCSE